MELVKLKPAVSKYWLITLAGLIWSIVGVMLCRLAYIWLSAIELQRALPLGVLGVLLSLVVYRYKFSKIARINIDRLCLLPDKSCFFAFQTWYAYLLIMAMIALGISMRHSSIPKHYLAVLYTAIGGALFLAGFLFFQRVWAAKIQKQPCLPPEK